METARRRIQIAPELWAVAGVALAAAFVMILFLFRKQGLVANAGDPYDYGKIAHGFVEHGFDRLTRRSAMLYPHVLWIIYGLGGNDIVVQVMHSLLHMGTAVLTCVIGRHLYNTRTGVIAGIYTALNPMLLRYVADLHTETMLTFVCTLTVWCAILFYDRPTVRNGIVLGVVGMLAALTKGVLLPFVVVFGIVFLVRGSFRAPGQMNPLRGVIAMFIAMAVVLAPWTYRNYEVSGGKFVLLTPGTPDAFLRGYIFTRVEFATLQKPPYIDAENESNALFRRIAREAGTTWELDEVADDVNNGRVMKRMIVEHPFDTARKVIVGLFTFWYEMTNFRNSLVPAVLALANWILAFIGLKRARAEGRPYWLLLIPVLVLNVVVAILVPLGRYSAPILPCLAILAAFGVDTLIERRTARQPARHEATLQAGT
jgi:4-amino-4-deoxy-L-arabinose transferase-like glycosyltransferase